MSWLAAVLCLGWVFGKNLVEEHRIAEARTKVVGTVTGTKSGLRGSHSVTVAYEVGPGRRLVRSFGNARPDPDNEHLREGDPVTVHYWPPDPTVARIFDPLRYPTRLWHLAVPVAAVTGLVLFARWRELKQDRSARGATTPRATRGS